MKKISVIATMLLAVVSCLKEQTGMSGNGFTIQAGFEQQPETRTYVKDAHAGTIWWSGSNGVDKVLFAFDQTDTKFTFTSTSTTAEAVRSFSCNTWSGGDWKYAIWTGAGASQDQCSLSGNVFSGATLKVKNPQTVSNSNSFDSQANIAVMKPEDGRLRNVFGYLRLTLPAWTGTTNISAVKSVTFTADEAMAGTIQIDYSGADPVVSIVDHASDSLTLNARWKNTGPTGYEAGVVYMILPEGTYHNAQLIITPFAEDPTVQSAATGEAFAMNFVGDIHVQRGKYVDCGTIPAELPTTPEPEPDPEFTWPNDADAFDYDMIPDETRKASFTGMSNIIGSGTQPISSTITVNDVTYGGPGLQFAGNRITANKVANEWSTEFPNIVPSSRYMSFKINKPGHLRFYPAPASKDGAVLRVPTFYLALVTKVNGVTSAKIVQTCTPTELADGTDSEFRKDAKIYSNEFQKYWVTLSVSEEDLTGIDEAATVYLYHRNPAVNTLLVHYWPLEWTVSDEISTNLVHDPKFILVGDSTCRDYAESEYPQNGWGQRLAEALNDGSRVDNYAVGGESSKSFYDSGKWTAARADILAGDLVLIQFGHNDSKSVATHHTEPATTFKDYLMLYINEARARGGIPVLLTSTCKRTFDSNGQLQRSVGNYPAAMRELATATHTPLVDIEEMTFQWLTELGVEGSVPYYIMDKRDPSAMDNTHLTVEGAQAIAAMVAQGLADLGLWPASN